MNIPAQFTGSAANQVIISAARCVLLYGTITNTSGAARAYALADSTLAPALDSRVNGMSGLFISRVAAGATYTILPVDLSKGLAFNFGLVLQSFALDASGTPILTALSAADMTYVMWAAALQ